MRQYTLKTAKKRAEKGAIMWNENQNIYLKLTGEDQILEFESCDKCDEVYLSEKYNDADAKYAHLKWKDVTDKD